MGKLRQSRDNAKTLERLSKIKNLRNALELMVDLQGKTFTEEENVTEYDGKTG